MDRIFSARLDDKITKQITNLAIKMKTSKKAVIERAIKLLNNRIEINNKTDIFIETNGIWDRKEDFEKTSFNIRKEFNKSMNRNKR